MGKESNYKKQVDEHLKETYKRPAIIETASLRRITKDQIVTITNADISSAQSAVLSSR